MSKSFKALSLLNQTVEADWTWTGQRFESGIQMVINSMGTITKMAKNVSPKPIRLQNQLILPGFVNVHSHCFQRALRFFFYLFFVL